MLACTTLPFISPPGEAMLSDVGWVVRQDVYVRTANTNGAESHYGALPQPLLNWFRQLRPTQAGLLCCLNAKNINNAIHHTNQL